MLRKTTSPRRRIQPDFASTVLHVAHMAVTQNWWKAMGRGQQVIVVHLAVKTSFSGWNQPGFTNLNGIFPCSFKKNGKGLI